MAKFCSNCGAPIEDGKKFCAACGHALQQAQTVVPQAVPVAIKKKTKTPIIFVGAAAFAVALVAVGILTKGFGFWGKTDDPNGEIISSTTATDSGKEVEIISSTDSTLEQVNVPDDVSDEEKLAYNYIELAAEIYQAGVEIDEEFGSRACANSAYAMAAATVSAMRYAVDCLLELKGTPPAEDDGKLRDWDEIAALGWASPFPYFFEGVVLEANGDSAGAAECYRKAALNPNFIEGMENFKTIQGLDEEALNGIKTTLQELEDKIFESTYGPQFMFIPRDENNFSVEHMRKKAMERLEAGDENLIDALGYYHAALLLNPYDGDNYANLVLTYLLLDDGDRFASYLNEGMAVDPENVRLKFILDKITEVTGK